MELLTCRRVHPPQRMANRQVSWCYLAARGLSHASQAPIQLDIIDAAAAAQDDLVCCQSSCMHDFISHL